MAFVEAAQGMCQGEEISKLINMLVSTSTNGSDIIMTLLESSKQLIRVFESTVLLCKDSIENGHYIDNHCQLLLSNLTSLRNSVNCLKQSNSSANTIHKPCCCSLLNTCFTVTNIILSFCKDVELNHTHIFDSMTPSIGPLFKSSYFLIKICSECIELLNILNEDHTPIIKVITSLFTVAMTTLSFDPSLILITWKTLGKLLCLLKNCVFDNSDISVCSVISGMCDGLIIKSQESIKIIINSYKEGNSLLIKLLKTCRFFATMIIKVVNEFNHYHYELSDCLLKFLQDLIRITPSSLLCTLNQSQYSDIEANITIVIEPLLISLINCNQFLQHLMSFNTDIDCYFPRLFLLCLVLKNYQKLNDMTKQFLLEETSSQWLSCRLLDCLFICIKACEVEFSLPVYLPGIIVGGISPYHVTLYEYLLTLLCSVIAILPIDQYVTVEKYLVKSLLVNNNNNNNIYCLLLVQDVWCFIARWGTSVLCYSHVLILIKLLFTVTDIMTTINIRTLLKRLIVFTTISQQRDLINQYPPNDPNNMFLWVCLPALDSTMQREVCNTIYTTSNQIELSSCSMINYNCIQCFNMLLSEPNLKPHLPIMMSSNIINKLIKMLNGIVSLQDNKLHLLIACELLKLFSHLLNSLNSDQLVRIFKTVHVICINHDHLPVDVLVGVAYLLANSGNITCTDTLNLISHCFVTLLSHTHKWLVLSEVLVSFRQFAETTPLANILEQCIPVLMNNIVVDYLHKVPYGTRDNTQLLHQSHISILLVTLNNYNDKDHTPNNVVEEPPTNMDVCREPVLELLKQWEVIKRLTLLECERKEMNSVHKEMEVFLK